MHKCYIIDLFIKSLRKIFPDLKKSEILHKTLFRETHVQPLQEINFLNRKTGFKTPIDNVYLVNSSMIYNSTLNNNASITLGKAAAELILKNGYSDRLVESCCEALQFDVKN